jgi:hypothetical protein
MMWKAYRWRRRWTQSNDNSSMTLVGQVCYKGSILKTVRGRQNMHFILRVNGRSDRYKTIAFTPTFIWWDLTIETSLQLTFVNARSSIAFNIHIYTYLKLFQIAFIFWTSSGLLSQWTKWTIYELLFHNSSLHKILWSAGSKVDFVNKYNRSLTNKFLISCDCEKNLEFFFT